MRRHLWDTENCEASIPSVYQDVGGVVAASMFSAALLHSKECALLVKHLERMSLLYVDSLHNFWLSRAVLMMLKSFFEEMLKILTDSQ